jgi:transketolase
VRRMLANTLHEIAGESKDLIFLTGDLGFGVFDDLQRDYPDRYINVGIAEAAMVTAAAGLSATGFMPIVYSIASFMSARPFEQIKLMVGYNSFPVILIGAGGGVTYGMSGGSHHATDDLGLMSLIPGLDVAAPAGPNELRELLKEAFQNRISTYIQIGKFGEIDLPQKEAITGAKILAVSTGTVSTELWTAIDELPKGFEVDFLHLSKLSEIPERFNAIQMVGYDQILVVEEHVLTGGVYSQILSTLNTNSIKLEVKRCGLPDVFVKEFISQAEIRVEYGFDSNSIKKILLEMLGETL